MNSVTARIKISLAPEKVSTSLVGIGYIATTLVDPIFMLHDIALYFHVFPTRDVHVEALVQWRNQCFLDRGEHIPIAVRTLGILYSTIFQVEDHEDECFYNIPGDEPPMAIYDLATLTKLLGKP